MDYYEIEKGDFQDFVDAMIRDGERRVVGVKSKRDKFIFDTLDSADELRLDYDVTILSPKNYFLPPTEPLLRYRDGSVEELYDAPPLIIIGIHPYDLIALEQMDTVFRESNPDQHYLKKREESILIGMNIQSISPHSFAGSMGTATTDHGFDLMLTDLGDRYAIEVGSEKGRRLLEIHANSVRPAGIGTISRVRDFKDEISSKFEKAIQFPLEELPALLERNYDNNIWREKADKCLKCGSCNLVCPTCYCFDVQDIPIWI